MISFQVFHNGQKEEGSFSFLFESKSEQPLICLICTFYLSFSLAVIVIWGMYSISELGNTNIPLVPFFIFFFCYTGESKKNILCYVYYSTKKSDLLFFNPNFVAKNLKKFVLLLDLSKNMKIVVLLK